MLFYRTTHLDILLSKLKDFLISPILLCLGCCKHHSISTIFTHIILFQNQIANPLDVFGNRVQLIVNFVNSSLFVNFLFVWLDRGETWPWLDVLKTWWNICIYFGIVVKFGDFTALFVQIDKSSKLFPSLRFFL